MPDRYSFSSPFGRGNDPWFRVGQIDVTTTVGAVGLGIVWFFLWAIEGPSRGLSKHLWLSTDGGPWGSVLEGQIWRLVTWPVVNEPDFWTLILFAVFYMLGSQVENLMGRRPFLHFLLALTIIPAIVVTLAELAIPDLAGVTFGLRFIEIGVLVAFAAQYPRQPFWPGIPAWGIAALIVGLDFLQILGNRDDFSFILLLSVIAVSLVGMRSFGYASEVPWIPALPLPASITGSTAGAPRKRAEGRSRGRGRRRGSSPLRAVPDDGLADMEIDALLDQVAEQGLGSLTKEQRKRLEEHSKRLRKKRDD